MNKKTILIPLILIISLLGITLLSAGLCKGNDNYYHDCNNYYRYHNYPYRTHYQTYYQTYKYSYEYKEEYTYEYSYKTKTTKPKYYYPRPNYDLDNGWTYYNFKPYTSKYLDYNKDYWKKEYPRQKIQNKPRYRSVEYIGY